MSPFLRLTLGDHLRDRGFEIIEAENGQQGLELFRLHSPDLVTLDLRMSPVSGQEVLEAIRDIDRNIPVIIISRHGQMHDAVLALRAGAFDYCKSPSLIWPYLTIRSTVLLSTVHRAVATPIYPAHFWRIPCSIHKILRTLLLQIKMYDIFRYCEAIAKSSESVLITGETVLVKSFLPKHCTMPVGVLAHPQYH